MEEEYIQQICEDIIRIKPDLIFTEKGISGTGSLTSEPQVCDVTQSDIIAVSLCSTDLAQHYLVKANITAIRRVRKTDNNRIAR